MSGKPVLAASAIDSVLFPDPASPVTTTRRPSAAGSTHHSSVPQRAAGTGAAFVDGDSGNHVENPRSAPSQG